MLIKVQVEQSLAASAGNSPSSWSAWKLNKERNLPIEFLLLV